ncbi:Apoptosis-antagonizing transcription factor C-terminal [Fasciola gigantica]|uniref:Apoptosis-antagonizing transcription factor C-terminal n=1 Tax=Fasciola gigantica TaxID=46835 RepID=A0A504YDT7_FASGI|nr:Apoptosis-antagonizing transcription factor C-terminal [Fasciola gigantica]
MEPVHASLKFLPLTDVRWILLSPLLMFLALKRSSGKPQPINSLNCAVSVINVYLCKICSVWKLACKREVPVNFRANIRSKWTRKYPVENRYLSLLLYNNTGSISFFFSRLSVRTFELMRASKGRMLRYLRLPKAVDFMSPDPTEYFSEVQRQNLFTQLKSNKE